MFDATAQPPVLSRDEIRRWLQEEDPDRLQKLWHKADAVREAHVGPRRPIYGVVDISNYCVRRCACCGLRAGNGQVDRHRLTADEILTAAFEAMAMGCSGIMLQSGEDPMLTRQFIVEVVSHIKQRTPLTLILSLAERCKGDWTAWKSAGADGYLLGFERSLPRRHRRVASPHQPPPGRRAEHIHDLEMIGYRAGSNIVLGLPGQTYNSVTDALLALSTLGSSWIAVSAYEPRVLEPERRGSWWQLARGQQIPNKPLTVFKAIALARLLQPTADIPSTVLSPIGAEDGQRLGLHRGANVATVDLTPPEIIRTAGGNALTNACSACASRSFPPLVSRQIQQVAELARF